MHIVVFALRGLIYSPRSSMPVRRVSKQQEYLRIDRRLMPGHSVSQKCPYVLLSVSPGDQYVYSLSSLAASLKLSELRELSGVAANARRIYCCTA